MNELFNPDIHVFYEHTQIPLAIFYAEGGRFKAYLASEGICRMYETTKEEIIARLNTEDPLSSVVEKEELKKAIEAFMADEDSFNVVYHEYIDKDHKIIKTIHCVGLHEYTRDGRRYALLRYDEISDSSRKLLFRDEEKRMADREKLLFEIDDAIARSYTSVFYVDVNDEIVHAVRLNKYGRALEEEGYKDPHIRNVMDLYVSSYVYRDDAPGVLKFGDFDYVMERLKETNPIFHTYRTIRDGKIVYFRLKIIPFDNGSKIVYGFEHYDEQMRERKARESEHDTQMTLLAGLTCEYESVWLVDAPIHHCRLIWNNIESAQKAKEFYVITEGNYETILGTYIDRYVVPEDRERVYLLSSIDNLMRNTKEDEIYHINYSRIDPMGSRNYLQLCIARVTDDLGVVRFVWGFRNIDAIIEEEKQRNMLYSMAHIDNMTNVSNRRTFDEYMDSKRNAVLDNDFVFFSFDLNQLKEANDSHGHEAGDELIIGAADCMKEVLGEYGTIYRTGGDEFAAVVSIGPDKLDDVMEKLKGRFMNWKGKLFPTLSISMGYVSASEKEGMTLDEMRREAEKRMYAQKSDFYLRDGNDRRRNRHY